MSETLRVDSLLISGTAEALQQDVVQCKPSGALNSQNQRNHKQGQGILVTVVGHEQSIADMNGEYCHEHGENCH